MCQIFNITFRTKNLIISTSANTDQISEHIEHRQILVHFNNTKNCALVHKT